MYNFHFRRSGDNCAYQEFQMYVQDVWDLSEEDSYKCQSIVSKTYLKTEICYFSYFSL